MPSKHPVLVIHGGAGSKPLHGERLALVTASLRKILENVYPQMQKGLSALDAVERAVLWLENDPLYNAGRGSKIQRDGKIRMSASIMDGDKRRFAGCVNVEHVKNPVLLARALMKKDDRVLSCEGAERFARELGLEFASNYTEASLAEFEKRKRGKTGTVGAVALDSKGRLAAATSTGGKGFEFPFRVSDSPTTAGNFANRFCAVSATGTGEEIVEFSAASTLCAWSEAGMKLEKAAGKMMREVRKAKAGFGFIALDSAGRFTATTSTKSITWAAATKSGIKLLKI
jgi:L-asparaginase